MEHLGVSVKWSGVMRGPLSWSQMYACGNDMMMVLDENEISMTNDYMAQCAMRRGDQIIAHWYPRDLRHSGFPQYRTVASKTFVRSMLGFGALR